MFRSSTSGGKYPARNKNASSLSLLLCDNSFSLNVILVAEREIDDILRLEVIGTCWEKKHYCNIIKKSSLWDYISGYHTINGGL